MLNAVKKYWCWSNSNPTYFNNHMVWVDFHSEAMHNILYTLLSCILFNGSNSPLVQFLTVAELWETAVVPVEAGSADVAGGADVAGDDFDWK